MNYSLLRIYNLAYTNYFDDFIKKIELKNHEYEKIKNLFFDQKVAYSNSFHV